MFLIRISRLCMISRLSGIFLRIIPKKGTRKACHSLSTPRKPVGLLGCSWLSAQSWLPGMVFFSNGSSIWCKTAELDKAYKKLSRLCFYIFSWLFIHSGHDWFHSVSVCKLPTLPTVSCCPIGKVYYGSASQRVTRATSLKSRSPSWTVLGELTEPPTFQVPSDISL